MASFGSTAPLKMGPSAILRLSLILVLGVTTTRVDAGDATVEFFTSAFLPQSVTIEAGETVTWIWFGGTHTLTSGLPAGAAGTVDEPGAQFQVSLNALDPSFSYTYPGPVPGDYHFFDSDNPGQIGTVVVEGDDETFVILVLDNVYEPSCVQVFEGDTVRWEHEPMEMLHTVTSGLSSNPGDNPGALFNEVSSDSSPVFEYLFTEPGLYPFFCIPHETLDMTGEIQVQDRFIRGDGNRDGSVSIADPIATLDHLFGGVSTSCTDAHDSNDDGGLDIGDVIYLLSYIFSGGSTPPSPFPVEGPDRTADALTCF